MKVNEFLKVKLLPRRMFRCFFTILCTLLLFVQLSFAQDFTARHLGDFGNVTVMEVNGNFDSDNPDGSVNTQPRQAIAKEFFRLHKDEYDFVAIFSNFDYQRPIDAVAYYTPVKNDVRGIGLDEFNYSKSYGSDNKLQGTIDMWNLLKLVTNPLDPNFNFTVDTLVHETLHRWGAYVKFMDWNGKVSNALIGYQAAHWSFLFDSGGSTHLGNKWKDNGDGTFTSTAVRKYYSPQDLYLMGMIDKSKVPPTLLIDNPAIDPTKMPEIGDTISGTARSVKIDDIIAVEGERVPNAKDSQKDFKTAFIYVVSPGTFKSDDLYGLENLRNAYLTRFSILTGGKGLVQVTSTPINGLPTNPGVRPPSITPRTLPPSIDSGVTWLMNHQQADGSWTDFSLTTERDTAESAAALQLFPVALQASQAGFAWLGSNSSANTDYLARRIEASVQAVSDSSALVQELLARRNRDGGWGSNRNFISSATDTALALKALAVAGYSDATVTGPAIAYLQGAQNADGGWSGDDAFSTIQPTASVLSVFNYYRKSTALDTNLTRAVAFLAAKQNPDGGFGNSPSTVYDSALAVIALQAAGADKTLSGRGVSYLLGQQSENGAWFDSPYQTALAVRAVWAATVDPDLSIKPEDISIIPATVAILPTNAVLSATVRNLGRNDVPQAKIAVYDGIVAPEHKVAEQIVAFPGQSPVTLTFSIPVTDSKGHVFHVVADPDNQLAESDKNNNSALKSLMPEISYEFQALASDITVAPNPAGISKDVMIKVKVSNSGTSDAYNVPVRIFIDHSGAPLEIATLTVDLPAGGSAAKETTWKASLAGINLPLTVQIDPNNTFTETNKANNSASVPLTVNASTLPDLSVSYKDMIITPSPAREGGNATISVLVRNDGFSSIENVKVNIYSGTAANNGILLGSQVIPVIAAGQSARTAIEWPDIPVNGGQLISVQVDPDGAITEIAKEDNFTFLNLDVLSLPDLAISTSSVVITPAAPYSGDSVAIAVTVQNGGEQEAHDVTVQLKEGGAVIGSTVIPLVTGNSQATGTIPYAKTGQTGTHQLSVTVDPGNLIVERTKANNMAVKTFSIQDANLWLTEPYISPNGDGIKDTTDFSFRLAAPAKVSVQVVNKKGVAVRTFSGGELDNTAGSTVAWDGKNDTGSVVDDGTYQIKVAGANNAMLASMPVEVDTNRSPLTDALGTKYLLQSNQTCMLPYYDNLTWLPDESGLVFQISHYQQDSAYTEGLYAVSPTGEDVVRLIPANWNASSDPNTRYTIGPWSMSSDGKKVVFVMHKEQKGAIYFNWVSSTLWTVESDGSNLTLVYDFGEPTYGIGRMQWSHDGTRIAMENNGLYVLNPETKEMIYAAARGYWVGSNNGEQMAWSPDNSLVYLFSEAYSIGFSVSDKNGVGTYYPFNQWPWGLPFGWVWDKKVLFLAGSDLMQFDASNGEIMQLATAFDSDALTTISPDKRFVAWKGYSVDSGITVMDSSQNATVIAEQKQDTTAPIGTGITTDFVWSQDGSALAYVDTIYDAQSNVFHDDFVIHDMITKTDRRIEVGSGSCVTSQSTQILESAKSAAYSNMSGSYCNTQNKVDKIIAWMKDKVNFLVQTAEGVFSFNSETGIKSDFLPVENYNFLQFSPNERYLTYEQYYDSSSGCFPKSYNQWAMSSLLNLTADLRISKSKTYVTLRGIASDKNFEGYRLEYADLKTPGIWNLIAPPSDIPVLNKNITTWVPPYEGSFLVRLTVWDKAGNQAVDRKRLNWGMSSLITNLYKTEEYISPNGDGIKENVELHYQVLEPVHLEFNVYDSNNNIVRVYSHDYTEPISDLIAWDGKDSSGRVVPDGQYRISVFDYEFFVKVDATMPSASIAFSPLKIISEHTVLGDNIYAELDLFGHATDINIKKWQIEVDEGENQLTWVKFSEGNNDLVLVDEQGNKKDNKLTSYSNDNIGFLKGKRFKVSAEDFAGNISSLLSGYVEEKIMITSLDGKNVINLKDIPISLLSAGIHHLTGFETMHLSTARRVLQYRSGSLWIDSSAVETGGFSGGYVMEWDTRSLDVHAIDAIRMKVMDVFGGEHLSTEISIYKPESFAFSIACNQSVNVHYEMMNPLGEMTLQLSRDNGVTWNDISSRSYNNAYLVDEVFMVPEELYNVSGVNGLNIRMVAKASNSDVYSTQRESFPKECKKIDMNISVTYEEATACNSLSPGKAKVVADVSTLGYTLESFKLTMKAPDGERLLQNFGKSGGGSVIVDTSSLPEGRYQVIATAAYSYILGGKVYQEENQQTGEIIVNRNLPQAQFGYPSGTGLSLCPFKDTTDQKRGVLYGINVEGVAYSAIGISHYDVYSGVGANPFDWNRASRLHPDIVKIYILGNNNVKGRIDSWDVTGFRGNTYSLQLRATDKVGNLSCTNTSFYLNEPVRVASIAPDRLLLASASGDTVGAGYQLTGPATVDIQVSPVLSSLNSPDTLGTPVLRNIANGIHYISGVENTSWDGRNDGGGIPLDGKYGLTLNTVDACQLTDTKWANIEIDNTPPIAAISYPLPKDPLPAGNIIEVKGTATDLHFKSYLLEAGEGENPSDWLQISRGTRAVSNGKFLAWNTFGLKDIWTLRLTVEDAVGNISSATSIINLGIRKDLIKAVTIYPEIFSPNGDQRRDTTHIAYEVTDACQIRINIINSSGNTVKTFIATTASAGNGSFDWDGKINMNDVAADGDYTVHILASLTGRPEVFQTEDLSMTLDTLAPQVTIPIPVDKAYYNNIEMPVVGSITDLNLASYSISVSGPEGKSILDSGDQNKTGYMFGAMSNLAEDTYSLTIEASDQGENLIKSTRTFTVDRTLPKVTLDTPKSGEFYGAGKNVLDITGTVVEKNLERYSLRYGAGESPVEWKEVIGGDSVPTTPKLSSLKVGKSDEIADGVYTLSLYAKDKAGLEGEARAKIVIDNTPPQEAITSPKDGDYVIKAIDIKGMVADTYFDNATLELAEGSCATAVKWAATKTLSAPVQDTILDSWKVLPSDGEYCLRLSAIDKSGNKSESKTGIKIDTHPPAAPQLTGKIDNKVDAVLSWTKNTETDLAGYNLYRNNQKLNTTLLADMSYQDLALKEGGYTYIVKAVDFAGNESEPSNAATLKIDLAGPTVRISTPKDGSTISNLVDIKGTAYSQDDFKEYRIYVGQGSNPSEWSEIRRSPLPTSFGSLAQWDAITSQDGAQFAIKLEAEDISGNISTTQALVIVDNTPPKSPVLLTATGTVADVELTWKANTEADLAGYLLYRNDQLATVTGIVAGNLKPYLVTGTVYADKALPDDTYSYYMEAMDLAGNISDQSNTLEVTIDTHPPHMIITAPVTGYNFETKLAIKAETTDNDIATVQFQYKRPQDTSWTNLGLPFLKPLYITFFDPKALNLDYGDYQLQALAVDKGGKQDPAPQVVTTTYSDLTPPAVPVSIAAKVNDAEVTLTWTASTESDLAGYNVYRWSNDARTKANGDLVTVATYKDNGLPDGNYLYEVTAVDSSGNESNASGQVPARIYAPLISQPYSPVKTPSLVLQGSGVEPNSSVEIRMVKPGGVTSEATVTADPSGYFKLEGVTLALGENRFSALATDLAGNVSKISDTAVVIHGVQPAMPTGLDASVNGYDVNLSWNSNSETDILGYNLFRDGEKVNSTVAVTNGQASASYEAYYSRPQNAIDGNFGTYWSTSYGSGTFTPAWWEMSLPEPALINSVRIQWSLGDWDYTNNNYNIYAGKDYEVQVWSGYNWVTLKTVTNNDQQSNTIDISPPYRTDRIRISISSTTDTNYSKYVRIDEVKFDRDDLVQTPDYTDSGLLDHRYSYKVTAVNIYGFESDPSIPATADVGDLEPPGPPLGLSATAQGSNVMLSWSPPEPVANDLAEYHIYCETATGWIDRGTTQASSTSFVDQYLSNGAYNYRVTANDLVGNESPPSNEASATVHIEAPSVPLSLTVSSLATGGSLDLAWQIPTGSSQFAYNIYRSQNEIGPFSLLATSAVLGNRYRDNGLVNGITYYYRVKALDSIGNESESSNTASGVPHDIVSLQPMILKPTMPGTPLIVNEGMVTVGGFAEPAAQVEIIRDGLPLGSVTASSQDMRSDTPIALNDYSATLSPDGLTLAYVDYSGQLQLRSQKSGETVLVSTSGFNQFSSNTLQWSPDGHYLLVSVYDYSWQERVALYNLDLAQTRLLSAVDTISEWDASWTPSGAIVFAGMGPEGLYGIWKGGVENTGATLMAGNIRALYPMMSPDGNLISYFDDSRLFLLSIADAKISLLDDNTDGWTSAWSLDGSKLVFVSYRDDGNGEFYQLNAGEGTSLRLTYDGPDGYYATWSPDGKTLAYATWNDDPEKIRLLQSDGQERELPASQSDNGMLGLVWLKSGDLIFTDNRGVHSISLAGTFSLTNAQMTPGENRIVAVATDTSGNRSEPSDTISVVFDTGFLPDLVIADSDITLFPPYPKPGEDVLVTARVHNPTNNSVDNVTVELYLWDGSSDVTLLKSEIIPHLDANGEGSVSVRFNAGTTTGVRTIIAVADPGNLIPEVLETNNYASKDMIITDQERVSVVTSLNSSQYGVNQNATIGVSLLNSGPASSGTLKVVIEDSDGNLVKQLSSQPQDLPYGLDQKLTLTWNTGVTYAGSYKVHAVVLDSTETNVLSENTTSFSILADVAAVGTVTTDKQSYGSFVSVLVNATFNNICANYVLPQLKVRVSIIDAQNIQLFSEEKNFTNLLPSMGGIFSSTWNTGLSPAGTYTALLELSAGNQVLATQSTTFRILAQPLLKGTLTVDAAVIQPGRTFTATYTVSNQGNSAAAGTVRVTLQDPDTQTIVASSEQSTGIPVNSSIQGNATLDTTGLALKTYQAVLLFKADTTWQNIAMATIAVKDGISPTVSIVSPQEGMSYTTEIALSVFASDDASGVDRVEYSIDNGTWKLLPLADPSKERYSTTWAPTLADNGGHTVFIRGTDRAGNTSQPVSVDFVVHSDTIPPVLIVSTLANGSYTNNEVLNISGTVTDDVGVKELLINGATVSFDSDGRFSYALVLADGKNTIEVKATDAATNQVVDSRTIHLDQKAPLIDITSPADNSKTGKPEIIVTGNVEETSTVEVRMNGVLQPSERDGFAFKATLTPVYGDNTIEVIAVDQATNRGAEKRTVTFDNQKPSLAITEPGQDIHTNREVLVLKGTVADALTAVSVSIEMDGTTFTPAVINGCFEQRLVLTGEGLFTISVTATDEVGNNIRAQRNVVYDITPPALGIDPVVSLTNQSSQIITGTREENTEVAVSSASVGVGALEYPTATTWKAYLSGLTVGDNAVIVTENDDAFNTSSVTTHIIYDTTPPVGTIAINSGAAITASTQVSLGLTASDSNGVSKMRVSNDGTEWSDPELFAFTKSWNIPSGDGVKQVFVSYQDNAGNWSVDSITTTIVLDTIPPVVNVSPDGGIYDGFQSVQLFTNEPATIFYTTDGSMPCISSSVYNSPLSITATTTLRYMAIDSAGNHSDAHTNTFVIDNMPPVLLVSTLTDNSYTNNEVLNISGSVSDAQSGIKELLINNIGVPVNPDGSFSQAVVLVKGTNMITVIATDQANNQASNSRSITLDQTAPNLVITAPADNSKTATALTNVSGMVDETSIVAIKLGGNLQSATMNGTNFSAAVTLVPGTNTIEVTARDQADNTSTQKRTVVYDDQQPSLAITLPAQDIRTNQSNLIIQGTASDPYTAVTVSIDMDGQTYAPDLLNGQFEQLVSFSSEKTYSIAVTATNEVGATTRAQRNVIFDVTPPVLTINPVVSPTTLSGQNISGTREIGSEVSVTCSSAVVGNVEYPTASTWRVVISDFVIGDNTITVYATDTTGNVTTASAKIVYSMTLPDKTFDFALFGNKSITMTGGSYTDSYQGVPANFIRGQYKDGNVGSNSQLVCSIKLSGGALVYGKALVGYGGNPAMDICTNGGSSVYNNTVDALTATKDMTPKTDPSGGTVMGALKSSGGALKTLLTGNYRYSSIDLSGRVRLTLNGQIILHIDGNLSISGGASIVITPGSTVTIYLNGQKMNISGGSLINNTLDPKKLIIYGTSGLQSVNLSGGTSLYAMVFAPTADIIITGGQNTYGSIIGNTVDVSGGSSVHFDESIIK